LDEARKFAKGEYATALMKGDTITAEEKTAVAKKVSRFTGLSEDYLVRRICASSFSNSCRNYSATAD